MVAAAPSNDDLKAAIDKVPEAYSEFIPIMTAEMTLVLLEHSTCDHAMAAVYREHRAKSQN